LKAQAILIALGLAIVMVASSPCLAVETYIASKTVVQDHQLIEDRITAFQIIERTPIPNEYDMLGFIKRVRERNIVALFELGMLTAEEAAGELEAIRNEAQEF
jgi:hypothetical protein